MVELEPNFVCNVSSHVIVSLAEAERLKVAGNDCFRRHAYREAEEFYQRALSVAPVDSSCRAAYHGNKAACHMRLMEFEKTVAACNEALKVNQKYVKVLMRRCLAYEHLQDNDKAMEDAKEVLEIEPDNEEAKKVCHRLQGKLGKQQEKTKDEMIGKLKDLGNSVLGRFGVSLDDFKTAKDPDSGGYNISFKK